MNVIPKIDLSSILIPLFLLVVIVTAFGFIYLSLFRDLPRKVYKTFFQPFLGLGVLLWVYITFFTHSFF